MVNDSLYPPESPDEARRLRSHTTLEALQIPYNLHLPVAIPEDEAKIRTPMEIAERVVTMYGVCVYSELLSTGESRQEIKFYLDKIDKILAGQFQTLMTPQESAYLAMEAPQQRVIAKFGWRYECCYVLLWALGAIDELGYPSQICDVPRLAGIVWNIDSVKRFAAEAKLRTTTEILDTADLILRYNWACVDARIKNHPAPANLDGEVVVEWHYAINWLVGMDDNADWDHTQTNT